LKAVNLKNGFGLIELLVSIAIVSLIAVIALPIYGKISAKNEFTRAVNNVIYFLADTRNTALLSGKNSLVIWVEDNHSLQRNDDKFSLPKDIKLSIIYATELGHPAIRFHPRGSSTGATITLSKDQLKSIIEVNWLTGGIYLVK